MPDVYKDISNFIKYKGLINKSILKKEKLLFKEENL
jgi:hypothetical protein